ncbi:hypothetical protein MSM1_21040 [Mycobacterium sp. SM1]|uniref:hypothetical protein n=1 Tax=Mycobacterium sp. SM1 TaxID=2816243 RepID=UPI001BCD40D2|nr:hypothetical protein [Mycobacterium sp. SM1]MBS4730689.1 hypothetical protein [Mycobacterium sp. SM1]
MTSEFPCATQILGVGYESLIYLLFGQIHGPANGLRAGASGLSISPHSDRQPANPHCLLAEHNDGPIFQAGLRYWKVVDE